MKRVILLKSLENSYDMDYIGDALPTNALSIALTKKFLPKWEGSPLKSEIIRKFHCLPCLRLDLVVRCEQHTDIVSEVNLQVEQYDLEREYWKGKTIDSSALNEMAAEYFRSIGYLKTECVGTEEVGQFITKLAEDVPSVDKFFRMVDIADEEELKWYRYHTNPYHNPAKVWKISTEYEGIKLEGEITDFCKSSVTVMMTSPANDLRMRDGRNHLIWGYEGKEIAHQLLTDLFHAYKNIHNNMEAIREKYKALAPEYADYDRKIEKADDFEECEALEFEKRNLFRQAFKSIIGYRVENIDSYLITNKLV
ncbi:MAG: hypothetical protein J6B31_00995 [Bacteroidaceae bacterium]|nr:hypothetical protein [Bacteroidaceae bacterium]